jgi:pheromone shutdown-related protein TraB
MDENVYRLNIGGKKIILVGTAHVSLESVKTVEKIIAKEKPDSVGVELCEKRMDSILNKKKWDDAKITQVIKDGQAPFFIANLMLSSFQKRIGNDLNIDPGAEMMAAIKSSKKAGSEIILLDRDIQITLKRAWKKMGFFEKSKILFSLFLGTLSQEKMEEEMINSLKKKDAITQMMEELSREAPRAKEVLIDERDAYIAEKIRRAPGKKIVAVVGAGHLPGIMKLLYKKPKYPAKDLETLPKGFSFGKAFGYLVPLIFLSIVLYGFLSHGSIGAAYEMALYWFLINGIFSAVGATLALAHPVTIAAAFFAAPFTSLNPTIGAGIVAGLVEAKIREPRVKDFKSLSEIASVKGFYQNRVSRILLVAALVNLGSVIGTFIALPYLISLIG